jgi:hypothetical protein
MRTRIVSASRAAAFCGVVFALAACSDINAPLPGTSALVGGTSAGSGVGFSSSARTSAGEPKIYVSFNKSGSTSLFEFGAGASGDVAPIRELPFYAAYGVDHRGNFWSYLSPVSSPITIAQFSSDGELIRSLPASFYPNAYDSRNNVYTVSAKPSRMGEDCPITGKVVVAEFAAGSFGKKQIREFRAGSPCSIQAVAADESGNVDIAEEKIDARHDVFNAQVAVFAVGNAGPEPTRLLRVPCGNMIKGTRSFSPFGIRGMTVNDSGSLLVDCYGGELFYSSGTTRYRALPIQGGLGTAIDDQDKIYAVTYSQPRAAVDYKISVYALGAKTPFKTIQGRSTRFPTKGTTAPALIRIAVAP